MWIKAETAAAVDRVARIFYIGREQCFVWNTNRNADEPRLLSGWCWSARDGGSEQHGIKTMTACYIDAYYRLVLRAEAPRVGRSRGRLRVVRDERGAA